MSRETTGRPHGTSLPDGRGSSGASAEPGRHLRAAARGSMFKENEQTEVHGSGADKCCGYKVTIDHRTLSRCIS